MTKKQDERTSAKFSTWCIAMAQWQAAGYEALYQWQRVYERNKPHARHAAPEPPRVSTAWVGDVKDFEPSSTGRYRRALITGSPLPISDSARVLLIGSPVPQESHRPRGRRFLDGAGEPETLGTRTEFTGH